MIYLWEKNNIPYFKNNVENQCIPSIKEYIVKDAKSCVVVCPGGGYVTKASDHEGDAIAVWLNSIGISAFVLDYRVYPYKHPVPVTDGKRAIRYARFLSDKYGYDKNKIGILGFSAGGHLAGSVGCFKSDFGYKHQDDIDNESSRPDFMILCYPVISFVKYEHIGSMYNLIKKPDIKSRKDLSLELKVSKITPPTFIWHTSSDKGVPVENSLNFAMELSKNNIEFEIHTYKDGPHGLGLAPDYKHTAVWTDACRNWLESCGFADEI